MLRLKLTPADVFAILLSVSFVSRKADGALILIVKYAGTFCILKYDVLTE